MKAIEILKDKSVKKLEARELIAQEIQSGLSLSEFEEGAAELNEKQIATFLEAVEMITGKNQEHLGEEYLVFAQKYILSQNNSCKREASRIVGNMAADYPKSLEKAIPALLRNTADEGTVVRWGSAYALSRIIVLDNYKHSELKEKVREIYESEQENGVKNQYKKALKRIKAI